MLRPARHLWLPLLAAAATAQGGIVALRGLDPVELCRGVEVQGEAELSIGHGLYKYRFASEANRRSFIADPERHAIQWGGACARMGPLSGRGDPDCFAVHDGRIYLFASDACRTAFLQDPPRCFWRDEPALTADATARQRGAALLARAIAGLGGRAIVGWKTLRFERRSRAATAAGERLDTEVTVCTSQGDVRIDQDHGDRHSSTLLQQQRGSLIGNDGKVEPMHPAAVRALQLQLQCEPLLLLSHAADQGFEVAAAGNAKVGDADVDLLQIRSHGFGTTLGIDAAGRIVLQRCRARGPQLWFGEVEWTYSDFRRVGAATLPFRRELRFDGKNEPDSTRQLRAIAVDPELAADCFAPERR